jgi:hypothetical protein
MVNRSRNPAAGWVSGSTRLQWDMTSLSLYGAGGSPRNRRPAKELGNRVVARRIKDHVAFWNGVRFSGWMMILQSVPDSGCGRDQSISVQPRSWPEVPATTLIPTDTVLEYA